MLIEPLEILPPVVRDRRAWTHALRWAIGATSPSPASGAGASPELGSIIRSVIRLRP